MSVCAAQSRWIGVVAALLPPSPNTIQEYDHCVLYVLEYRLADNYLADRGAYRDEHLRLLRQATEAGQLIAAGALEHTDRSLIVWTDADAAYRFVEVDPYVSAGLVLSHDLRPWNVAAGTIA